VIDFPQVERPSTAIIVVAFGRRDLIHRALEALRQNTPPVYEIVLVDNASPDDTADWLEHAVRGATVLRGERNVGFGSAANWGAMAAKGRYLVFLNSDAFVHEGWLDALIARVESFPNAVASVPRLLNLDGTLQEAGPFVGRDGSTFAHGYGDDPGAPDYGFARIVDYGSAACLLVLRSAFARVGGFDPAYGIGYCEDVDLALALAARGMLTVYEPRAVVSHVRHGSSSPGAADEGVMANRETLLSRWRDRIARQPPLEDLARFPHRIVALRDAPTTETMLVVQDRDQPRARVLALAAQWPTMRITLVALGGPHADRDRSCRDAGIEVVTDAADWPSWFAARRYHYSLVAAGEGCDVRVKALIRQTQPQATRVEMDAGRDGLVEAMAALGVLPARL
jgi:GT2 family glycosyltransferase